MWIARDANGSLFLYLEHKPTRKENKWHVPLNTNYRQYMINPRNGHKQIDTEFFVGGMQWKDFEKENIDTELLIHISSVLNLSPASFFEDITPSVMQNGTKNILVGRDNNGNISTNECQDKLEDAMIEIKHLKAVIEGKDKLLEEKERLINVLMNK